MVRIALDSNVLVYAELEPESDKGRRASQVITAAARDAVIPAQVFGEYLNVVLRKKPDALAAALRQTEIYRNAVKAPPTTLDIMSVAIELARDRKMQFWDCVICVAAGMSGVKILLSEDMQDGSDVYGLRIVNPFAPKNDALIEELLGA